MSDCSCFFFSFSFYNRVFEYPPKWITGCCMTDVTWKCCRPGDFCVHHNYNQAPRHITSWLKSRILMVHACLAVTCHLHFWQNDLGLLRVASVTGEGETDMEMSQHRNFTLAKKILPPLLPGLEPATYRSQVRRSNHRVISMSTDVPDLCGDLNASRAAL